MMEDKKHKIMVGFAAAAFGILSVAAILSQNDATDKVFGVKNFYSGNMGDPINPKAQYESIYNNDSAKVISCTTALTKTDVSYTTSGNFLWFVGGVSLCTDDNADAKKKKKDEKKEIKKLETNKTEHEYKPFNSDGIKIVAPGELVFVNANAKQSSKSAIDIIATMGSDYKIEFLNVKTWWCHIGKKDPSRHTDLVGNGGISPNVSEGYIIGEAKKDTIVRMSKKDTEGNYQVIDLMNLFLDGSAK